MTRPIPTVHKYMTASPHTVEVDQSLGDAHSILYQHRIRHLPVLNGTRLVGMLTERDFALMAALKDIDLNTVKVAEAMSLSVYIVSADAPIDRVAKEMASKRLDSAVVVQDGTVTGILTSVDLCSALATSLHVEVLG